MSEIETVLHMHTKVCPATALEKKHLAWKKSWCIVHGPQQ